MYVLGRSQLREMGLVGELNAIVGQTRRAGSMSVMSALTSKLER